MPTEIPKKFAICQDFTPKGYANIATREKYVEEFKAGVEKLIRDTNDVLDAEQIVVTVEWKFVNFEDRNITYHDELSDGWDTASLTVIGELRSVPS